MVATAVSASGQAIIKVQIAIVPEQYSPPLEPMMGSEPVSKEDFYFEINRETRRTRIVVEYRYVGEVFFGADDGWFGPRPTKVQLPGLRYDPQAHQIVYEEHGERTVCALVQDHKGIFRQDFRIENTGLCTVTTQSGKYTYDDGWALHHWTGLQVYFEVHPSE